MNKGFTLIEIIIISAVVALVTTFMIRNINSSKTFLNESVEAVSSDVRGAQSRTISGANYEGDVRCGYGINRVNDTSYLIYVGPIPDALNNFCDNLDRKYNSSGSSSVADTIVEVKTFSDGDIVFKGEAFDDIFFEPPDPKTYIDGSFDLNDPPERILMGEAESNCSGNRCKSICIYPSGKIEVKAGDSC